MCILNLDAWRPTFSALRVQSQVPQSFVSGWNVFSNNPGYNISVKIDPDVSGCGINVIFSLGMLLVWNSLYVGVLYSALCLLLRFQPKLWLSPECRRLLCWPYFCSVLFKTAYLFDFARALGTQDSGSCCWGVLIRRLRVQGAALSTVIIIAPAGCWMMRRESWEMVSVHPR